MGSNSVQNVNQLHQYGSAPQAQFGYPPQYHQQLLEASGTHSAGNQNQYARQPNPNSSPQIMSQGAPAANQFNNHMMNQGHAMNTHQMQQMQQNNYYGGQNGY